MLIRYTIKRHDGQIVQSGFYDNDMNRDRYAFSHLSAWAFENDYVVSTWRE